MTSSARREHAGRQGLASGLVVESRLAEVGTTIFTHMSALAQAHGAINLSQGFPDYSIDPALIDRVDEAMRAGRNQYAPMAGWMPLRERVAEKYERLYARPYDPDTEVTITAGATQAIFTAIAALVRAGDEVIIFEPAYDSYAPAIRLQGATVVRQALAFPGFGIDHEALARAITPRTRMLIVNSPNNPGTSTLSAEDLAAIERVVAGRNIVILSDEVYEHIVFDGRAHHSLARSSALAARSLIVTSFGKTFHATGWKVGAIVGPRELMQEFRRVHQFNVFCVNSVMQCALAEHLGEPARYEGLADFFQEKRDYFLEGLRQTPFLPLPSQGSYFLLADFSRLSDEKDVSFAERLTREHGVATIPLSVFHGDGRDRHLVRFCFAKARETLDRALERLARLRI